MTLAKKVCFYLSLRDVAFSYPTQMVFETKTQKWLTDNTRLAQFKQTLIIESYCSKTENWCRFLQDATRQKPLWLYRYFSYIWYNNISISISHNYFERMQRVNKKYIQEEKGKANRCRQQNLFFIHNHNNLIFCHKYPFLPN